MAAGMFAAATNLTNLTTQIFSKPTSLSAYTLHSANGTPSGAAPSPAFGASSSSSSQISKGFAVGLWRVIGATHKTTGKDVSVWMFEKRVLDGVKGSGGRAAAEAKEWVVDQMKKEATSLSRLRHPDLLHMVEPLEDTRTELTFVTERVTASLHTVLHEASTGSTNPSRDRSRHRPPDGNGNGNGTAASVARGEVDLDEVEIQKGVLQVSRALSFLHGPGKSVHLNLTPEAILINVKGDWKLSGLSLLTPLQQPDGSATRYTYPEVDHRIPQETQWKYDYLAPEYALDSQLSTSNDLYSLGCVLYALHMGGRPPFSNSGSMQSLREHAEGSLVRKEWMRGSKWERCSGEVKDLLPRLLTRHASSRLSLGSLPSHPFFSSLAISTLNFLDPTTFASKPREEKATFLRGLVRVLPTFSDRLRRGKVLPSLLEEMKDSYLLPFLLPNVFEISKSLTKEEFTLVLPKLQPLFALKDPPQNMLTLLENLSLFEDKTLPPIFRENVMPLVYNSLECEHLPVQEKVLKLVPHLCEILDYGTVHNVLLVKVAILFTRTRVLSIKVLSLQTFQQMVSTLDKATLTTKVVPLMAKIKTREPAVMMATLGVHEAMGQKVDREAIATLVLPQLWAMSMGPLLNQQQFGHFMKVIKDLGGRVEREHGEHLRDVRRLESSGQGAASAEMSGLGEGWETPAGGAGGGEIDFETLVKGQSGIAPNAAVGDIWVDDWASGGQDQLSQPFGAMTASPSSTSTLQSSSTPVLSHPSSQSLRPSVPTASANRLKARPVPSSNFNAAAFGTSTQLPSPISPQQNNLSSLTAASSSFSPIQPQTLQVRPATTSTGPNYSVSLAPQPPTTNSYSPFPSASNQTTYQLQPSRPQSSSATNGAMQPVQQAVAKPPPGWTPGLMQPTKAPAPMSGGKAALQGNWSDFDPLI